MTKALGITNTAYFLSDNFGSTQVEKVRIQLVLREKLKFEDEHENDKDEGETEAKELQGFFCPAEIKEFYCDWFDELVSSGQAVSYQVFNRDHLNAFFKHCFPNEEESDAKSDN